MKNIYMQPVTEVTEANCVAGMLAGSTTPTWTDNSGTTGNPDGKPKDNNNPPTDQGDSSDPDLAKGYTAWQGDFWDDWY